MLSITLELLIRPSNEDGFLQVEPKRKHLNKLPLTVKILVKQRFDIKFHFPSSVTTNYASGTSVGSKPNMHRERLGKQNVVAKDIGG